MAIDLWLALKLMGMATQAFSSLPAKKRPAPKAQTLFYGFHSKYTKFLIPASVPQGARNHYGHAYSASSRKHYAKRG